MAFDPSGAISRRRIESSVARFQFFQLYNAFVEEIDGLSAFSQTDSTRQHFCPYYAKSPLPLAIFQRGLGTRNGPRTWPDQTVSLPSDRDPAYDLPTSALFE